MDITSTAFRSNIRPLWDAFLKEFEPLRSELFRFGLSLTHNPFDAEDLIADSLLKAFTQCAIHDSHIDNPRAYIARIMVTSWTDEKRRGSTTEWVEQTTNEANDPPDAEIAIEKLITLEARSRAVLVLKEVLGYTHEEIANMLSITITNAKVLLHRAKSNLNEVTQREPRASRVCVERFVAAFLTYDVDEIRKVLINDLVADNFPVGFGTGTEHHIENGWVRGSFYHHDAENEATAAPYPLELEVRAVCGEPVALVYRDQGNKNDRALEEVWRLEESDGLVAKITDYCFREDLVEWTANQVGARFRPMRARVGEI